jgi:hypothetical protein
MKKMKLSVDTLRVESFATAAPAAARGTVRGNAAALACNTDAPDCDPITCAGSCIGPCTSNGGYAVAASAQAVDQPVDGSANPLCTSPSYLETCIFYTCGGCDSMDPEYC